jgi:hypothetical protein
MDHQQWIETVGTCLFGVFILAGGIHRGLAAVAEALESIATEMRETNEARRMKEIIERSGDRK